MMRIVVLDGYTLNPGDLDWSAVKALGDCVVYDRTTVNETLSRAAGAEVVLTNKTRLTRECLGALPDLRYIGVLATGYDVVDVQAAAKRGIPVTNAPGYGTASVAQSVFTLLLELTNDAGGLSRGVHSGRWAESPDYCYWDKAPVELSSLTMGIIGYGAIGQATARIAHGFGMRVIAHTCPPLESADVEMVDLDTLFAESDVISLHCPLTPQTRGLIGADRLASMKSTAYLINTARGPIVEEPALAKALRAGQIAGAGLDVLCVEPPDARNPLYGAPNCIITPHVSWATAAARGRLMSITADNLRAFLVGAPRNVVNGVAL